MSTIESMRELDRQGVSIAEIARLEHVSEPAVRKYISIDDLSPKMPVKKERGSKLDECKPLIEQWLEGDAEVKRKQRHTARRAYDRLKTETDCAGGCTAVQKFVKRQRRARQDANDGFLDRTWPPGGAQVDFGEADFHIGGLLATMLYLVVPFPFSNVGFGQLFWGGSAECACEGPKAVFECIGGVPSRCVFDNAAGVGRRVGDAIKTTETFRAFASHCGFSYTFCNPYSGHEKGNAESKVGFIRRNVFVPVPRTSTPQEYDKELLNVCLALSDGKPHYCKDDTERELFAEDVVALSDLPAKTFKAIEHVNCRADKHGKAKADGERRCSSAPEHGRAQMIVGLAAFNAEACDENGALAAYASTSLRRQADRYRRSSFSAVASLQESRRMEQLADARDGINRPARACRQARPKTAARSLVGHRKHGRRLWLRRGNCGRRAVGAGHGNHPGRHVGTCGRAHGVRRSDRLRKPIRPGCMRYGDQQQGERGCRRLMARRPGASWSVGSQTRPRKRCSRRRAPNGSRAERRQDS